jgi:hypothetical protein
MPAKTKNIQNDPSETDFVAVYYQNQYDRVAKLETLRSSITAVITTLTVGTFAFTFSGDQSLNIVTGVILPIILIISNLFAILYIAITYQTISAHLRRANKVLRQYAPKLSKISKNEPTPPWTNKFSLAHGQLLFHLLLIVISVLPIWMYFFFGTS